MLTVDKRYKMYGIAKYTINMSHPEWSRIGGQMILAYGRPSGLLGYKGAAIKWYINYQDHFVSLYFNDPEIGTFYELIV
jgi:hypothetical protein